MRDNRIWNLMIKMTTHSLSSRNGILALLMLRTIALNEYVKLLQL